MLVLDAILAVACQDPAAPAPADPESAPTDAPLVARWEWPPWLLGTGHGADFTLAVDELVLAAFPGTTVPAPDCRAFEVQPFAQCRVTIDDEGQACPIYEEFTFNDVGEVSFVEAWSDQAALLPMDADADPWATTCCACRPGSRGCWFEAYEAAGDGMFARGRGW